MSDKTNRGPRPPAPRIATKPKKLDDPDYATKKTLVDYTWKPQADPVAEAAGAVLEEAPQDEELPVVDVEMEPID